MKFGKFVGLVLALGMACGVAAQAQVGVYGMYSATRFSGIQCFDPSGKCSSANGKVNPAGGFGGVYYDFKNYGPVRLGVDFRAGVVRSNKSAVTSAGGNDITTSDSYLGGVRGSFHTPIKWVKPYVLASVGFNRSDAAAPLYNTGTAYSPKLYDKFLQYEFFGGVDLKVFPAIDFRPIELGIGNMNRIGSGNGSSSIGVMSLGAGIVFHMPTP